VCAPSRKEGRLEVAQPSLTTFGRDKYSSFCHIVKLETTSIMARAFWFLDIQDKAEEVKNLMKRNMIFITALLISFAILMPTSALGCKRQPPRCEKIPPVSIEKEAYCMKPPRADGLDTFSNNGPYLLETKYYWWIEINVTAKTNLTNYRVEVYDRLGAEFMIEGICVDTPKQPHELYHYPGSEITTELLEGDEEIGPFDYIFDYSADGDYEPGRHEEVTVHNITDPVADGHVDWCGVWFDGAVAGDTDTFRVFWTGNSCKAHFKWIIGHMEENESKIIYLVVSTDVNPGGRQEFTSPGITYLNSGATVKVLRHWWCWWRPFYSATTSPIPITVEGDQMLSTTSMQGMGNPYSFALRCPDNEVPANRIRWIRPRCFWR
jgi:hypothetical protein